MANRYSDRIQAAFYLASATLLDALETEDGGPKETDLDMAFEAHDLLGVALRAESRRRDGGDPTELLDYCLGPETEFQASEVEPACSCPDCRKILN